MILTFSLKRSLPQSNKQATWHKADSEGGSQVMSVKCGWWCLRGSHAGDFASHFVSFFPGLFFFLFFLFLCVALSWCSRYAFTTDKSTGPGKVGRKTQGFPLYLCSQQGITLLLCPGSKPFAAGSSSQDGSSLQGWGIFLLPPPQQACVQASLFMLAHFMCFAVGSHRLPRGRMSPSSNLTKAATVWKYNHLFILSSSLLSRLMEHCFIWGSFFFCLVWHVYF